MNDTPKVVLSEREAHSQVLTDERILSLTREWGTWKLHPSAWIGFARAVLAAAPLSPAKEPCHICNDDPEFYRVCSAGHPPPKSNTEQGDLAVPEVEAPAFDAAEFLAAAPLPPPEECEDEGCPHYGTPHGHPAPTKEKPQ